MSRRVYILCRITVGVVFEATRHAAKIRRGPGTKLANAETGEVLRSGAKSDSIGLCTTFRYAPFRMKYNPLGNLFYHEIRE